ncbi:2OG-Fe(II) oxygenase [Flavobacterium sp.]
MQKHFEEIIESFLEKRVGISNKFLSIDLAEQLKANLLSLYQNEAMKLAGIGNDHVLSHNRKIRSDKIYWLDNNNENAAETAFFRLIDEFIMYLNQTCYAGINSHEFHYALYEKGTFYKKHLDQFKTDDRRVFSMILYLNEGWATTDGGELKVYQQTGIQIIAPENQKCVFFKSSELEHEVLLTNVSRMSITGWLKTS